MVQPNDIVPVFKYLEEWNRCISSRYQRDSLYRHGRFDSCSHQFSDLKIVLSAKIKSNEAEALDMIANTYYKKNLGSDPANSPTAGFIWKLKNKPGWDVLESDK
mmetsp:Transcript_30731/g.45487  ORF Transcript_30731/g.45487 Transcript_30731/m.45487 type:complete len:104 (-) Transcript_30731:132-443(-)